MELATAAGTCHCGRTIERDPGEPWRHMDGWTMCDPRNPQERARLHPSSLPDYGEPTTA